MKHTLLLLVAFLSLQLAKAQDFEKDGISYSITSTTPNTVEVDQKSPKYTGAISIPTTVLNGGITYSVTGIGDLAFYSCTGLTSITIPEGVISIGDLAFISCTGLTSLVLPSTLTSIAGYAFYDCTGLSSINAYMSAPPSISSNVFEGVDKNTCALNVDSSSQSAYGAAPVWSTFININGTLSVSKANLEQGFTLYPNPVQNTLNINQRSNISITSVSIYNVVGKLVLRSDQNMLNVSSLQSGLYVVNIETLSGTATKKFIKQ